MPELQIQRHELFAQGLVEGKSVSEAFEDAGYTPNRGNASRMKANESIIQRVAELRAEHRSRHDITVDDLCDEFDKNRELALSTSQAAAANGATMGKARLLGLDKGNDPSVDKSSKPAKMSDMELARRLASLLESSARQ